jgi:hypothetical protein
VGWFGFGWGSEFETRLEVSADGSIIIHEHGTGAMTRFTSKNPVKPLEIAKKIVKEVVKKTALTQTAALDLIEKLNKNSELRHSYGINYGVTAEVPVGSVLYSQDRGLQELQVTKEGYRRSQADGRLDFFNHKGQLTKIADKSGYFIGFNYKDGVLESIKDSHAKQIFFSWYPGGLVKEMWSAGDKKAFYKYNDKDLVYSKDLGDNIYEYKYDTSKNLIEVSYTDKTKLKISYDPKTFFVTKIVDRNGEETNYEYG